MSKKDTTYLTPTEELMMEVLAARTRMGECWWTFVSRPAIRRAANSLGKLGYVIEHSPQVERTLRLELTEKGRKRMMAPNYTDPRKEAWDDGYYAGSRDYMGAEPGDDVNEAMNPYW